MSDPAGNSDGTPKICDDFSYATNRTVALAIELAVGTLREGGDIVDAVMKDKAVQAALAEALRKTGQEMMAAQTLGATFTLSEGLGKIGRASKSVLKKPAESQIRKLPEFHRLERGLKQFKCAFDHTDVGVFVNEHKTLLIVVGVVAAFAGGTAMYIAKAGDAPASLVGKLKTMKLLKVGGVTISAGGLKFVPSERRVEAGLNADAKWTSVKGGLDLKAAFANDQLVRAEAGTRLVLTIDPLTSVAGNAAFKWTRAIGETPESLSATAELGANRKVSEQVDVSFRLFGRYATAVTGNSGAVGGGISATIKRPFGKGTSVTPSLDYSRTGPYGSQPATAQHQPTDDRIMLGVAFTF